jgi:hypothetical protein
MYVPTIQQKRNNNKWSMLAIKPPRSHPDLDPHSIRLLYPDRGGKFSIYKKKLFPLFLQDTVNASCPTLYYC